MSRLLLLDSTPLALLCRPPGHVQGDACRQWLTAIERAGIIVVVPEVADYEMRRELIRLRSAGGLVRLDNLGATSTYAPITTTIMRKAAEFWADLRNRGVPTAPDPSLDADAILAAQTALIGAPGDAVTLATSNPRHLIRFPGIDAHDWPSIVA